MQQGSKELGNNVSKKEQGNTQESMQRIKKQIGNKVCKKCKDLYSLQRMQEGK